MGLDQATPPNGPFDTAAQGAAVPDRSSSNEESPCTVRDSSEGLILSPRANLFQAGTTLAGALAGAGIGVLLVPQDRLPAALCGAFLGLIVGVSAGGLALMFVPARRISLEEAAARYERARRRAMAAGITFAVLVPCSLLLVRAFGGRGEPWSWGIRFCCLLICFCCFLICAGACAKTKYYRETIEKATWKPPP